MTTDPIDDLLEAIAKEALGIETLERRNSDSLDFHEVSVWGLRKALRRAYEAGKADAPGGERRIRRGR